MTYYAARFKEVLDLVLRFEAGTAQDPLWSPDGRYIVFGSLTGGMLWTRTDGAGTPQSLIKSKNIQVPTSFAPGGTRLLFVEQNPQTGNDIWTLPIENDGTGLRPGKPEVFLATPFQELQASYSPDCQTNGKVAWSLTADLRV